MLIEPEGVKETEMAYRDDYERQAVQCAAWQASTPKLSVHAVEPATLEQRNAMAMFNLRRPATEAWFNRGWFEIACALTIPTEEHQ